MTDAFEARIQRAIAEEMRAMTSEDLIVAALRTLSFPRREAFPESEDGTRYVTLDLAESAVRQARKKVAEEILNAIHCAPDSVDAVRRIREILARSHAAAPAVSENASRSLFANSERAGSVEHAAAQPIEKCAGKYFDGARCDREAGHDGGCRPVARAQEEPEPRTIADLFRADQARGMDEALAAARASGKAEGIAGEDLIVAALRTLSRPIRAEGYDGTRYVTLDLAESAVRQARLERESAVRAEVAEEIAREIEREQVASHFKVVGAGRCAAVARSHGTPQP